MACASGRVEMRNRRYRGRSGSIAGSTRQTRQRRLRVFVMGWRLLGVACWRRTAYDQRFHQPTALVRVRPSSAPPFYFATAGSHHPLSKFMRTAGRCDGSNLRMWRTQGSQVPVAAHRCLFCPQADPLAWVASIVLAGTLWPSRKTRQRDTHPCKEATCLQHSNPVSRSHPIPPFLPHTPT